MFSQYVGKLGARRSSRSSSGKPPPPDCKYSIFRSGSMALTVKSRSKPPSLRLPKVTCKKKPSFPNFKEPSIEMTKKESFALATGIFCLAAGVFFVLSWDTILESQKNKQLILSENSKTYEAWVKSRFPLFLRFYFFDWKNPGSMSQEGYKPIFEEKGPYTFREIQEKTDLVWNKNGTLSYRQRKFWYFERDLSVGDLSDQITSLNVVAKSAAYMTRNGNLMTQMGLNVALTSTQSMFVTKTVNEHLFEGYQNSLLDTARSLPAFAGTKVPFDRFGWFYKRNGSTDFDGIFNIETGVNGMENFAKMRSWNYNDQTPYYGSHCGQVRGSSGQYFPPKQTKEDILELFTPELCRYIQFKFVREEDIEGITGYRYEVPYTMFDNGKDDPLNSCFCSGECAPPGAQNVSACRLGAPAFVSLPHFLGGDPSYTENVVGLKPDPKRHGVHITIEPMNGIPLEVEARFQINILVQPYRYLSMYSGIKPTYFPILWFEQAVRIPTDTVGAIKTLVLLPKVGWIAAAILFTTGLFLILGVLINRYCRRRSKKIPINDDQKNVVEPMIHTNGFQTEGKPELQNWNTRL